LYMNIWVKGILGTYAVGILYVRYVLKTELRQAEKQKGDKAKGCERTRRKRERWLEHVHNQFIM